MTLSSTVTLSPRTQALDLAGQPQNKRLSILHEHSALIGNANRVIFPKKFILKAIDLLLHTSNARETWNTIAKSTGASGSYLFLDKRILRGDNDSDVVNNSGLAAALGLKNVFETPQIAAGTVMITKRDVAQVVGLREDLTIENYDMTVGGLYDSDLVIRFDVQEGDENGAYKITSF